MQDRTQIVLSLCPQFAGADPNVRWASKYFDETPSEVAAMVEANLRADTVFSMELESGSFVVFSSWECQHLRFEIHSVYVKDCAELPMAQIDLVPSNGKDSDDSIATA